MINTINTHLYKRFGLNEERAHVLEGFFNCMKESFKENFDLVLHPASYHGVSQREYHAVADTLLDNICYRLHESSNRYRPQESFDSAFNGFMLHKFSQPFNLEETLFLLQIVLDEAWKKEVLKDAATGFAEDLQKFVSDFPLTGLLIKTYKTKAPQLFYSTSSHQDREISDTLGVLDTDKYRTALNEFEAGLRIFAKAKTDSQFKDVIEDLYGACDELVKIILNDGNKGLKHVFGKEEHKKLGLNNHQKEMFKKMKYMMDSIKHGSKKNLDRYEVEMIISMSASFIRFVTVKNQNA